MNQISNIEFFNFEDEVYYRNADGTSWRLEESSREVIRPLLDKVEGCYSTAHKALNKEYARYAYNIERQQFKMARRFIRCNFGKIDNIVDIDGSSRFNFEHNDCPLRGGDCPYEGKICNPPIDTGLGKREMEVMRHWYNNKSQTQIAELLGTSEKTVRNQINNSYAKLGIHDKFEFAKYAQDNQLFKVK